MIGNGWNGDWLCLFRRWGLVRGGKEGRIGVGIGCSYGAVNAGVTDDRPRSWKAWPQSVCLFAKKGNKALERLPKFHESLPQNSWKGIEDDGKRGKGSKKGFSVVKEGQAATGRTLMARDLVGVTLAT